MATADGTADLFAGFEAHELTTPQGSVNAVVGGSGPPVLLLHGYPQSHLMWHAVAPLLAEHHTVVATDLTGYGASSRPAPTADHEPHSKRAMARDQVAAIAALGFDASPWLVTTVVPGWPTGWRSTIPTGSSGSPCSTSSRPARCGVGPTGSSRRATGTGPFSPDVRGQALDATHFLAEDRPEETAAQLLGFSLTMTTDPPTDPGRSRRTDHVV